LFRYVIVNTARKGDNKDDDNDDNDDDDDDDKYTDLEIDVRRIWKVRTEIVPVITGALSTIKKGLDQNLQLLQGHRSAIELQKRSH